MPSCAQTKGPLAGGRSKGIRVDVAISLTDGRHLDRLWPGGRSMAAGQALAALGWREPPLAAIADSPVTRLHFGNEFCETLIPVATVLARAVERATQAGVAIALTTPMSSDGGVAALRALFACLPAGCEVVVNDWGVMAVLRDEFPRLVPVAGRLLCKMIKDPRLPSAEWARLYPHGVFTPQFRDILARFGVGRIELDVPPYADIADLRCDALRVSAHAPFGYSVKGRSCKIGSLHLADSEKFAIGHSCKKECLYYAGRLSRPAETSAADLHTFQRGNTVFYRHSPEMAAAVLGAVRDGWIDRLVLSGDWNEDHGADQPH